MHIYIINICKRANRFENTSRNDPHPAKSMTSVPPLPQRNYIAPHQPNYNSVNQSHSMTGGGYSQERSRSSNRGHTASDMNTSSYNGYSGTPTKSMDMNSSYSTGRSPLRPNSNPYGTDSPMRPNSGPHENNSHLRSNMGAGGVEPPLNRTPVKPGYSSRYEQNNNIAPYGREQDNSRQGSSAHDSHSSQRYSGYGSHGSIMANRPLPQPPSNTSNTGRNYGSTPDSSANKMYNSPQTKMYATQDSIKRMYHHHPSSTQTPPSKPTHNASMSPTKSVSIPNANQTWKHTVKCQIFAPIFIAPS